MVDSGETQAFVAGEDSGSPAAESLPEKYLIVARALRAHGVQGEIACEIITDFPQRFKRTKRLFLSPPRAPGHMEPLAGAEPKPFTVEQARLAQHRGFPEVLLKLEGVSNREGAEQFCGWLLQAPETEAWPLPRGRYYWSQIIGLRVVTSDGEEIGAVSEILETGANDVYVVKGPGGERLIPAVKQFVLEISPERGEIIVTLIPGM